LRLVSTIFEAERPRGKRLGFFRRTHLRAWRRYGGQARRTHLRAWRRYGGQARRTRRTCRTRRTRRTRFRRQRSRLVVVDTLNEHFTFFGVCEHAPVIRPPRIRGFQRLGVEQGPARPAAGDLQMIARACDHVVVGLLGGILAEGHERAIAGHLIVGDFQRREQRSCVAGTGVELDDRSQSIGAAQGIPIEECVLRRVHDHGAIDQTLERRSSGSIIGDLAKRDDELRAVGCP
jgi:hypothetical protein